MKLPLIYDCSIGRIFESHSGLLQSDHRKPDPILAGQTDPIRAMERASIRAFMEQHKEKLKGRVLDFGAGEQPYRDLVEGEYVALDHDHAGPWPWDQGFQTITCNQVLQYLDYPDQTLCLLAQMLDLGTPGGERSGHLILTYATNWDEVPNDCYGDNCDRWRFTKKGMEDLLNWAGFEVLEHQRRCEVRVGAFTFPIGYGVVARVR